ncbi:MAG: M16 family metallopeptidase, partial [Bryobacteraceae bacterium]
MQQRFWLFTALLLVSTACAWAQTPTAKPDVTRATLGNGMRVVIIRDPLAPVATLENNYLAGADETTAQFPGMAHAQEHMAFRGCNGLTADQIAAIYAQLGGYMDADTQQNITQYFVTVPSRDLDVALRVDAACMAGIQDSQQQWDQERGAIEQEVSRDLSNPTYKFIVRLNKDLFAGTPYEHDALGTIPSFDKTTGAMLQKFSSTWYAPNNSIMIVTGDVDPAATLAKIKRYYGSIPRKSLPAHPHIQLKPVTAESFTLESKLPYLLTIISYRFPGTDSPDFAAARILADVLASQRASLYALVPQGKALGTEFSLLETYPKASAAFALAALPAGADPGPIDAEMKKIIADYAAQGVPADLVDAAKKGEIASAEFSRNSITNLAGVWSQALAAEHRHSPEEDVDAMKGVTLADVNRVARKYLADRNSILATLKPAPSPKPVTSKGFGGTESATATPTKPVALPDWAEAAVKSLEVPHMTVHPYDTKLPNCLRLIVQHEAASPTVTVIGDIKTQDQMETPPGEDGVSDVLGGLFSYG